jgi:hypothetical protein
MMNLAEKIGGWPPKLTVTADGVALLFLRSRCPGSSEEDLRLLTGLFEDAVRSAREAGAKVARFWLAIETMDECARLVCRDCEVCVPFGEWFGILWYRRIVHEITENHRRPCAAEQIRRAQLRRWAEMEG